ncbi:MAG: DUF1287 domain-containing protein [bacterium]|jgi:uncharacterized protein YijF (DUF1287 family)
MLRCPDRLAVIAALFLCLAAAFGLLPPGPTAVPPPFERQLSGGDANGNNIDDWDDFVAGARAEATDRTVYRDGYYAGGYPPAGVGVCTDVVWRAFAAAGYDLKSMVDSDIAGSPEAYPRVDGRPEPNIDFRRVANLLPFFTRHALSLTLEIVPDDRDNLAQWQGGDIVVFGRPLAHIGIISDRRRPDGVPLLLHNTGPHAREEDALLSWPTPIVGHFRYPAGRD